MRSLWITRITAGSRQYGVRSRAVHMHGLGQAGACYCAAAAGAAACSAAAGRLSSSLTPLHNGTLVLCGCRHGTQGFNWSRLQEQQCMANSRGLLLNTHHTHRLSKQVKYSQLIHGLKTENIQVERGCGLWSLYSGWLPDSVRCLIELTCCFVGLERQTD